MSSRNPKYLSLWATALLSMVHVACGSDGASSGSPEPSVDSDFESADPMLNPAASSDGAVGSASTTGGVASNGSGGSGGGGSGEGDGDDPGRVIEEADIVKVAGDRLYAMSRYGGVAVIDVSNVDEPKLLGRHRVEATPFEMYVKDGIVFALYQDYGEYIYDEDAGTATFTQSSQVVVIDAEDAAGMSELDRFAIPGAISDSRIVGDILYVAAFENGYCWSCEAEQPRTTVMSLDVRHPAEVAKVDELSFNEQLDGWGWKRSLSVTDERMYIAGPEWGPEAPIGSTIQVVDISDPAGDLVEGDSVQVVGQINSRWQMDEHEGVLRVITQPFEWDLTVPPSVETFRVNGSDDLEALASLNLTLPRPEQLQSVRFDGARAYAITFEQTDPLFTIDLSNPEAPVQAGMLEMPGWLYHMEPRGDRLVGLGYDQENEAGALAVSLFDVSNLEAPKMLDRANFGGDWAWLAEDQDRIHKAFRLFDDAGLIVMPFSGYVYPEGDEYCYGSWVSGVQLIDWQNDELKTRGIAEMSSEARRGFLHDERLVAVSDERVEVFDISDRDAPARTGNVALAQYVSETVGAGNAVLRIGQSWYSNETEVDVVALDDVSTPRSSPGLEVGFETGETCQSYSYLSGVLAGENDVYMVYNTFDYSSDESQNRLRIATLDVSDAGAPALAGSVDLEVLPTNPYDSSLPGTARGVVRVGEALVFNHHQVTQWSDEGLPIPSESGLYVVDLSDPTRARTQYVELPLGRSASGLVVDGSVVARSHYRASADDSKSVRFYLERVDVSDPAEPRKLPSLNIPGSIIALSGDRAFTVDFEYRVQKEVSSSECYENARVASFEPLTGDADQGTCTSIVEVLTLIRIDGSSVEVLGTEKLQADEAISNVAFGDEVMFALVNKPNYYYYGEALDCYDCFYVNQGALKVLTLGGLAGGELSLGRVELSQGNYSYYGNGPIVASGQRALVSNGWLGQLTLIDASDPTNPQLAEEIEVGGYVSNLSVVGSTALVSMGYDGVEAISLDD